MTHTKLYEASSVHTIGYSWAIVAPAELTEDQIIMVCRALTEWTDTPCQEDYEGALEDGYITRFFEDEEITPPPTELLQRVEFQTRSVHRECFVNDNPKLISENPHDFI